MSFSCEHVSQAALISALYGVTHHMKCIRSECQRMGQETAYQLKEEENRVNDKHNLDARGLGDSHNEHDDVG